MKLRIVIDTSVLISALLGSNGASRELIRCCLEGKYQPLMGNTLFLEYESVVFREEIRTKCILTETEILTLLESLMHVSLWIDVYYLWRPNLRDESDNHLIELAIAGNAQIIATKNVNDFLNSDLIFPNLSILKPEQIIKS
ncbi:putative toxin-antitoxin system toxin component, PIN family [Pseudanabaena sp. FACHB-1277]|uniref:Toxin-antitoxin system toxin component, PIN family n=1 Tax=Pseudanabaena cinerea FACHB-1277 TaxID=2949581 RepID=A0A926UVU6_9CYAN|nr:putative toxin-antitoxin system toxin component, PIN family [Pseudanabaena cinerea]MBD2151786.1 putative toxin-antitoxin system toxin component, PIN family [Pseudanabaena cinerea FACHB-1277]